MKRTLILGYGIASYLVFLATFLYAIDFVIGFGYAPTALDGEATGSFTEALMINMGLLVLFALQHSVMARPAFKRVWTRIIPESAERSTYVLASSLAMIALFYWWQPMGMQVWSVQSDAGVNILTGLYLFGWALLLYATFLIDHFDLFGLRQVWLRFRGRDYTPPGFRTPALYRFLRHPIYLGWLVIFWATPNMTAAHLLFSLVTTLYILSAIQLEERDLVQMIGDDYRAYRASVPMIIPFTK